MHRDKKEPSFPSAFVGNPVTLQYIKSLDPGSKAYRDDRYTDGIYLALKQLSVVVKQPMDFQSIVVEFALMASCFS